MCNYGGGSATLIGSSSGVCCCVILEHAVLNRLLKTDVQPVCCGGREEWRVSDIFESIFRLSSSCSESVAGPAAGGGGEV